MVKKPVVTDPVWIEEQKESAVNALFLWMLKDKRDVIFPKVMVAITATTIPAAIGLFFSPTWLVFALAVPYLAATFLLFGGRYGLMLHANGHRPIFRRKYSFMRHYVPFVLGPFLGHTPTSFSAHHMKMHHAENNLLDDNSTTLCYKRDSITHFAHYWARFFFMGTIHLSRYLWLRGKTRTLRAFVLGELSWFALAGTALWVNWAAALVVFIIPMLLMRFLMMAGNWAQHAFVDLDDPNNCYLNSNNLTNTVYNHQAYNDGYHIVHHIHPGLHWTEMAQWHADHVEQCKEHDAIVLDGIHDNLAMWILLMFKRYDTIAKHVVNYQDRSHDEIVAWLKTRTQRTMGRRRGVFEFEPALKK